jgi:hypothetical protein
MKGRSQKSEVRRGKLAASIKDRLFFFLPSSFFLLLTSDF